MQPEYLSPVVALARLAGASAAGASVFRVNAHGCGGAEALLVVLRRDLGQIPDEASADFIALAGALASPRWTVRRHVLVSLAGVAVDPSTRADLVAAFELAARGLRQRGVTLGLIVEDVA